VDDIEHVAAEWHLKNSNRFGRRKLNCRRSVSAGAENPISVLQSRDYFGR
jgi:hypothetical protein